MFFVALRGIGIAARHETILGIKHPTFGIDPQALPDGLSIILGLARVEVDCFACELAFGLR